MNGTAIANRLQNSFKIKDNNVYRSSYYWNFRTSSFKQVACLILIIKRILTNVNNIPNGADIYVAHFVTFSRLCENHTFLSLFNATCFTGNTNVIVSGLTWPGIKPAILDTRRDHDNENTTYVENMTTRTPHIWFRRSHNICIIGCKTPSDLNIS